MKTIAIIDDEFYFRQVLLKYIAAFADHCILFCSSILRLSPNSIQ